LRDGSIQKYATIEIIARSDVCSRMGKSDPC
jgi:hypothetical protein